MKKQIRKNVLATLNSAINSYRGNHGTRAVITLTGTQAKRVGYQPYFAVMGYGQKENLWVRHDVNREVLGDIITDASLKLAELRNKLRYNIDDREYVKGEIAQLKADIEARLKDAGIYGILKLGGLDKTGIHIELSGELEGSNSGYGLVVSVA